MNILILNNNILAVDPIETADSWQTADQIIPKHVAVGAALAEVAQLPADYAPGRYTYNDGFIQIAQTQAVPEEIDAIAALVVLENAGLITALDNWLATQPRSTQEVFRRKQTWRRDNEILISGATAMGITSAQLDSLFITAGSVVI